MSEIKVFSFLLIYFLVVYCGSECFHFDSYLKDLYMKGVNLTKLKAGNTTVSDFVEQTGYPIENHYVTTKDGYILNIHRIPAGKTGKTNGKVAFLLHGLFGSSSHWIIPGPSKGLGFILADEGYDVWIGNVRGNTYSRNHTIFNPDEDSKFWNFSWHEMGVYDLPSMIDYILNITNVDGIYYCGHSQGTTIFYVMSSCLPEYNDKIKIHVGLAPIAYMRFVLGPFRKILIYLYRALSMLDGNNQINKLVELFHIDELFPRNELFSIIGKQVCYNNYTKRLCSNIMFITWGLSPEQLNATILPNILEYSLAGSSFRQIIHYAQGIKSGRFQQYDYGERKNMLLYGRSSPPSYPLDNITTPAYLIHSKNDWLSTEYDVMKLCLNMPNCIKHYLITHNDFNHMDFCFGISAPELIYTRVLSLFNKY